MLEIPFMAFPCLFAYSTKICLRLKVIQLENTIAAYSMILHLSLCFVKVSQSSS